MIKLKPLNPMSGRNKAAFRMLNMFSDQLRDFSIDITSDDDFDFLLIGTQDFIDKKAPLHQSIESGLEFLSKVSGDYILIDSSDSTSLMGAYEILSQSKATYLLKPQLLYREEYKIPSAFGKWWFGKTGKLNLSYDIPDNQWSRIKLTGWNLGHWHNFRDRMFLSNKQDVDIFAVFSLMDHHNFDHGMRNDIHYNSHRKSALDKVNELQGKYRIFTHKRPFVEYMEQLSRSKFSISPHGMGEINYRDFETILAGSILVKPEMDKILTVPDIYIKNQTYLPVDLNFDNLEETIVKNISNLEEIRITSQKTFKEKYDPINLCLHWYNLLSQIPSIQSVS